MLPGVTEIPTFGPPAGRGPYTAEAPPNSCAPMSGALPEKPSLTFGRTVPASTALQLGRSVITCGGTEAGEGPGTSNSSKHPLLDICMPWLSRPVAAANENTSG